MQTHMKTDLWNLPNSLSVARIAATPLLIVLMIFPERGMSLLAAFVFAALCLTDWLDGYLARRMNIITPLGKFLDPLADKLLIVTALVMLIPLGRVPAWMVALIIGREIAVTGLRAVAAKDGIVIQASRFGKSKTVAQIVAVTPLIIHYPYRGVDFHILGMVLFTAAFALTIWSGVDYFLKFFRATELGGTRR
ncbi:MAG TPA: CDP-diacylglycerol--glycerol-3-phosphate 3-phosphatidyltransferase [Deltaproteobacteria bacterium]|nr:CDP-diacylglycerol--glycerol-3-phosphate 3-phosphatidyltransferase [Deltaproteobacteria bacterium]